jgi:hypothetical protein
LALTHAGDEGKTQKAKGKRQKGERELSMKAFLSLLLTVILALPGCATARASRIPTMPVSAPLPQQAPVDPKVMADYVRQLKIGSRVRLARTSGEEIRGILMKNDGDPLVVQRRARIPEAPIEIPLREVLSVELETKTGNPARTVAIGAVAAVSATLGVLLILAAIFSD